MPDGTLYLWHLLPYISFYFLINLHTNRCSLCALNDKDVVRMLSEWVIMLITFIIIAVLCWRWFYRWLHSPATMSKVKLGKGGSIKDNDPNVKLLTSKGYQVLSGRHIIPFAIELNGKALERSANVYIDYIAIKNGKSYIVKYERERRPLEYTSNQIRDHLLLYALLLPDMYGILYINHKEDTLSKIVFHLMD